VTRIGVVTGLTAEARLIGRHSEDAFGSGPLVACAGPGRGTESAERLITCDVAGLVSFGLAGGLDPWLKPGDLVCPDRVLSSGGNAVPTDQGWRKRLMTEARMSRLDIHDGALIGCDAPVSEADARHRLAHETGAVAVDMESHGVAAVAEAHGLPFIVLRAIADTADRTLPPAALTAVDSEGNIQGISVMLSLIRAPGQVPAMIGLARDTRAGMGALSRAAGLGSLFLGLL
jgi:adenosylhomocysteine nucleosidase